MDNDDEGGYDPRDFVYSQSSDSGSDDEMINLKIKNLKYREYQAPVSRNINNTANQKELTTEYYNSEGENSMDSFCRKLQKLDVDTSQYTLSFSKLLSTPRSNIPSDYSDSADEHLKTPQNYSRSKFTCIRLSDTFSSSAKWNNSYSQSLQTSKSVDNNTLHSIEDPLQFGCNHPEYPITKLPSKTLSSYSHQKKTLNNQQIMKNTIPTRSNPKRTSTIILPSYENKQKVKRLIVCKKTSCGKSFATESELEVHEQTIHPYKCHYCNSRFDKTYSVEKHMYLHTLKFPMECEVPGCGNIFYANKPYEKNTKKLVVENVNNERSKVSTTNKRSGVNEDNKGFVENVNNERSKVNTNNKRSGVNEDDKGHKINMNNKRCRVSADNESSEVRVDRVVVVITDINR
ncbi:16918_t:CDS:2 [Dentiscutata erythropus]|uniref:16918_t:CDS:1 n=1 Tax=Dentiscutata erythropus TaxID=1348616 RepID=A0A9N9BT00_9GLOM|nr:16918_t:CDS:2 [Dentiscutata erythropus]